FTPGEFRANLPQDFQPPFAGAEGFTLPEGFTPGEFRANLPEDFQPPFAGAEGFTLPEGFTPGEFRANLPQDFQPPFAGAEGFTLPEGFTPGEFRANLPEDFQPPVAGAEGFTLPEGFNFDELIGGLDAEINDPLLFNPDSSQSILSDFPLDQSTTSQFLGLGMPALPILAPILSGDIDITDSPIAGQIPFVNNDITAFSEELSLPFADSTL
ncbi:MAG: hypothetical protein SWX82_01250, partial [Cyanobacteriota bacterium]|nr:hypothetical protein [Cyanobacteriota bacterium]